MPRVGGEILLLPYPIPCFSGVVHMKIDSIKQYVALRESLVGEKRRLEARLGEIDSALGNPSSDSPATERASSSSTLPQRGRKGRRGPFSLKSAVLRVVSNQARTKEEILDAVKQMGYRFKTSNPMNSLGVILYGKSPKFRRENGRFSYSGPSPQVESNNSAASPKPKGRKISPEGLARIAAAQRARWAKQKAGR
jgi:hypothetical protein